MEKAAEQLRVWAYSGMDKTFKRAFSIERRIERMRQNQMPRPTKKRVMTARFSEAEFFGDEVLKIRELEKSYGDKLLFKDVELLVEGGERIALIGDNGTGKSSLLKILMEEERPDGGRFRYGPSVRKAYLPQIIHFDVPSRNLVDTMLYAKKNFTTQAARDRLAAYQFQGEDVFKPVSVLSGGEQSRLRLCMLMDEEINFLVLDEPTNHLDIASREWIEEAVEAFDGTLLFVSHDRYFINRFATRIWELEGGKITDYPMTFERYRAVKAMEKPEEKPAPKPAEKPQPTGKGNKAQQAARKQLTICQREIEKLEEEIRRLEEEMQEHACDYEKYSALYAQKEEMDEQLMELMEKWEQLAEEAGE